MTALGFRCSSTEVRWALLSGTRGQPAVLASERIRIPRNMTRPQELCWLRQELKELLATREPDAVAYKRIETSVRKVPLKRVEAEAIVQEVAAASGVSVVEPKLKSQLKRDLHFDGQARYILQALEAEPFPAHQFAADDEKEAVLAAWSLLPQE